MIFTVFLQNESSSIFTNVQTVKTELIIQKLMEV